jgi:MFS family permease
MDGREEGLRSAPRFIGVEIPPELTRSHFFNLYLASLFIACIMAIPAVLQPAFLKDVINIPREQAGSINSGLQNMSQVATLLFIGWAGIVSDRVGRRVLIVLGFLVCGIFFILFGHAKDISLAMGVTSVGGQIFVTYMIRFMIGFGIILCWPQTITMVADYTYVRDRGKAMAMHGALMGLGSIIVFGVLAQIARKTGLLSLFYMSGALGFLGLVVARLGTIDRMSKEKAKKLGIREIYKVVSKNFALKTTYVATLITRADIVILATFLIVWMVYVAEKFGLTPVKATAKGGIVMMVMGLVTFVAFPIIGVLADRFGRVPVMIVGLFCAGIGFCLIGATENPFSGGLYLYACMAGLGFSAASLAAGVLTADLAPKPLLGSILGGLHTMQPISILFFLQLGGFLFDNLGYWSPFQRRRVGHADTWARAARRRNRE